MSYIVTTRERNMAVCDTLKEVFSFLKELKNKGIKYANILGAGPVRLTENGFWVWTDQKDTNVSSAIPYLGGGCKTSPRGKDN